MKEKIMTKGQLKSLAGVTSDTALAEWFTRTVGDQLRQQSVSKWGQDRDPIPVGRHWQIKAMVSEGRIKPA